MRKLFFAVFSFLLVSGVCLGSDLHVEVQKRINTVRRNHGLSSLKINVQLKKAAQSQSDWMAEVRTMTHLRQPAISSEEFKICNYHPVNRVVNSGYFLFEELFDQNSNDKGVVFYPKDKANEDVGEIVAKSAGGEDLYRADIIVNGWMKSQGHREAILKSNFKEFGVGITSVLNQEVYWCVVFANR